MDAQHFRWDAYQNNLQASLSHQMNEGRFCDVTLGCKEGIAMRAHRSILCANSGYFDAILSKVHPLTDTLIIMPDCHHKELKLIMDFMYNGEIVVEQAQLHALRKIAQDLQIKGLTEVLKAAINPINTQCKLNGNGCASTAKPFAEPVSSPEQRSAKKKRRRFNESEDNDATHTPAGETRTIDVINEAYTAPSSTALLPIEKIELQPINENEEVGGHELLHNDTMHEELLMRQNEDAIKAIVTSPEQPAKSTSGPTETQAESQSEKEATTSEMICLENEATDKGYQPVRISKRRLAIRDGRCLLAGMALNDRPSPNIPNTAINDSPSRSCDKDDLIDDYVEAWSPLVYSESGDEDETHSKETNEQPPGEILNPQIVIKTERL